MAGGPESQLENRIKPINSPINNFLFKDINTPGGRNNEKPVLKKESSAYLSLVKSLEELNAKDPKGKDPFIYPEKYEILVQLGKYDDKTEREIILDEYKRIKNLARIPNPQKKGLYNSVRNYTLEIGMITVYLITRRMHLKDLEADINKLKKSANTIEADKLTKTAKILKKANITLLNDPPVNEKIEKLEKAAKFFRVEADKLQKGQHQVNSDGKKEKTKKAASPDGLQVVSGFMQKFGRKEIPDSKTGEGINKTNSDKDPYYDFYQRELKAIEIKDPERINPLYYTYKYHTLVEIERINGKNKTSVIKEELKRISEAAAHPDSGKKDLYWSVARYTRELGEITVFLNTERLYLKSPQTGAYAAYYMACASESERLSGIADRLDNMQFKNIEVENKAKQLREDAGYFRDQAKGTLEPGLPTVAMLVDKLFTKKIFRINGEKF